MENFNEETQSTELNHVKELSCEIKLMKDPLMKVKKILEEINVKGAVMEVDPELLTLLVNNTQSLVEEIEKLREQK